MGNCFCLVFFFASHVLEFNFISTCIGTQKSTVLVQPTIYAFAFLNYSLLTAAYALQDTKALLITQFSCPNPVIQYAVFLSWETAFSLSCSVFHWEDLFSCLGFTENQRINLLIDFIKKKEQTSQKYNIIDWLCLFIGKSLEIAEACITCFCWQGSLK